MNFKALLATASIAATSLIAAPAQAATSYCYENTNGATVCILSVIKHNDWPYPRKKLVKSSVDGYVSEEVVYCNPAHRYNYKKNMYGIACFEFN